MFRLYPDKKTNHSYTTLQIQPNISPRALINFPPFSSPRLNFLHFSFFFFFLALNFFTVEWLFSGYAVPSDILNFFTKITRTPFQLSRATRLRVYGGSAHPAPSPTVVIVSRNQHERKLEIPSNERSLTVLLAGYRSVLLRVGKSFVES